MVHLWSARQWQAWAFIGWHGLKGRIARALGHPRGGLAQFRAHYVAEGLPPVPARDRARWASFMRCTACGACDTVCSLTSRADALEWRGPMAFALAMARSAPHYPECRAALALMSRCADCRRCESICPERIPLRALAEAMRDALAVIDASRPATAPAQAPGRADPG